MSSLRSRLLAILIVAVVPSFGLAVYTAVELRWRAAASAIESAEGMLSQVSAEHERLVAATRVLLDALTHAPVVRDRNAARCSAFFADLIRQYPAYANMGAADADGTVFCSALPMREQVNIADRPYFTRAVRSRAFAAGGFQIGRITGRPSVNYGSPVLDASGAVRGVVFAAVDLGWLNRLAAGARMPEGAVLTMVDSAGTILARHPDHDRWIGRVMPEAPVTKAMLSRREGTAEVAGVDGVRRVYAFAPLGGPGREGGAYVAAGTPSSVVFAAFNRLVFRLAALLVLAAALATWVATAGANRVVLEPVRALAAAAGRLAEGDLSARTGLVGQRGEMGELARAFDGMAAALQARQAKTERAEAARRAAEARFADVLEIAADAIIAVDAEQRIILFNRGAERIFGYRADEALGGSLDLLLPPRFVEAHRRHVGEFAAGPDIARYMHERAEVSGRRKDGSEFPAEASISKLTQDGQTILTVIVRDITERKRAEEELRRTTRALRVLSECNQALVRATEESELLQNVCQILVNVGGYRLAWIGFAEQDERKTVRPVAQTGYDEGYLDRVNITWADTERGRGPTGTAIRAGKPSIARNILTDPGFAPWRVEAIKRGYASSIALPLISGGRILGALNIYAAEPDAFDAEEVRLLTDLGDDLAYGILSLRVRAQRERAEEEIRRLNAELEHRVIERTAQLAERERDLRAAREEADRANQAKSEFLSRMSHELRTPLNAVLGFGQLLEMDDLTPTQREGVAQILKGGRHLLDLINEVLDIARIEAGRMSMSPEPVPVGAVIRESMDLVAPLAAERHVHLLRAGADDISDLFVLADRQRLKQVLLNLLSNAVKFNRQEGTVSLSCQEAPGARVRIGVRDTGPGIPPERMERLFVPFERLGAEQVGVEGTGLGLALSRRLVEAMGGTLGVESEAGVGSTFWVELPAAESPHQRLERAGVALPGPADLEDSARVRIVLYIEDNLPNMKLIQHLLAHRPEVRLIPAMQGRLGLELAREHRPHLVLLDLHLPDIPGDEVLRRLQESPKTQGIPVVVISADATPGQVGRLIEAGARDYLTKPLDVRRLMGVLDSILGQA